MSTSTIHVRDSVCPFRGDERGCRHRRTHSGQARRRAAEVVEGSITHMLRHLDKPLQISALSSMAGFSSSHFFALFKSATGCAPKEFFIRLRMQRACDMFMARPASVKEVAAGLGYEDQFYFSRLFKSVTGIAPRDYRQKMIRLSRSLTPRDGSQRPRRNSSLADAFTTSLGLMSQASAGKR